VRQPRFALEISEDGVPSRFVNVPEVGGLDSTFFHPSHHPLPAHEAGNSEKTEPSAVELVCKVDGDAVTITATVVFGPFDNTDTRVSLQGHPQQKIGTYSPHLNESIVLRDMEQFGLQPWTIKIVNAQMPTPASLPTVNEVPSIQPEIPGKDREGYRVGVAQVIAKCVGGLNEASALLL
jgi:hypothetical protein